MFIRIVRPQIQPGQAKEAAKRWQEFAGTRLKENPNLRAGYMAANSDGSALVAVTLWDQLPDEASTRQFQSEIQAKMQDIMSGPPPPFEEYEVLAKI
jgi:hypothetical protein